MKLSALLKARREELGLSQLVVARALDYEYPQNISYYESGKRTLPLNKFQQAAKVLELHLDDLADAHFKDLMKAIINPEEET